MNLFNMTVFKAKIKVKRAKRERERERERENMEILFNKAIAPFEAQ